ncbi:MAG: hypothetical protein D6746_14770 [Bacteroidetes bacterium]|nr:MAG: hypothetical protein D6746_14770 [Bacteroidota bacterium]
MIKQESFDDYLDRPGASATALKAFAVSAKYGAHRLSHPIEETANMRLGTLVHMRILEPERADEDVHYEPRLKAMMPQDATLRRHDAEHPGKIVVPEGWRELSQRLADAVMEDDVASHLVKRATRRETTLTWTDKDFPCKARIDGYTPGFGLIDLKVTSAGRSPHEFAQQAARQGWDIQNAWYQRACVMTGLSDGVPGFAHVCIDPLLGIVRCYELDLVSVESGWKKCLRALSRLKAYVNEGKYLDEPSGVVPVQLPIWSLSPGSEIVDTQLHERRPA